MITLGMLKSTNENELKRVFSWLTKYAMGKLYGSIPVGWYQKHQIKALDYIIEKANKFKVNDSNEVFVNIDTVFIRTSEGPIRLASTREIYNVASDRSRK
jgi:hypothetical protein